MNTQDHSVVDADPSPPYPNPPIVEAVIDVRTALPDDVDLERLGTFGQEEKERYPTEQKRMEYTGEFKIEEDQAAAEASGKQVGFAYVSGDGKQVVQVRLHGFTFSRLHPYQRWEDFEEEAMRLWGVFRHLATPQRISRIAVRYINRIRLPEGRIELTDYLRTHPEISPDLPQEVGRYFFQVVVPLPKYEADATMTQTIITEDEESFLVLDNDVARLLDVECDDDTDRQLHRWLGGLRDAKNEVFEASITSKARRMFA
jgi:uncharacterized protein (TIGR04255 family)